MTTNAKSSEYAYGLLNLIFQNTIVGGSLLNVLGIRNALTPGNVYLSLHTANPLLNPATGTQLTSEVDIIPGTTAYIGYTRVVVSLDPAALGGPEWTVNTVLGVVTAKNAKIITFPQFGIGSAGATITHYGVGTAATSAGHLLYAAALTAPLVATVGHIPQFAVNALTIQEA